MKKLLLAVIITCLGSTIARSQNVYSSSGMEMIFSFANTSMQAWNQNSSDFESTSPSNIIRWAPILNLQSYINYDMNQSFGFYTGLFLRNVGFISDIPPGTYLNDPSVAFPPGGTRGNVRYKFRTYNIGIPRGIKLGKMNQSFIYGGYEVAYAFNYKEKRFTDGSKSNTDVYWFGSANDRTQAFQHGFFVGIQFPYGSNIKFKYYVSEFFNQDYTDGSGNQPYAGFEANVFFFSLSFNVLKNTDFYYYNPDADYEELSMK